MASRRYGVLVVTAVVALGVSAPPALGARASGENGKIVFTSDRDGGDWDIWSMRPGGGSPVNLTPNSEAADFGPSWRPDGRKLAFMSTRRTPANLDGDSEIFVMNADGSGLRQLTANALDDDWPTWSPDGRKLLFQRDFDPIGGQVDYDLFRMQADGTRQRNLTNSPGITEHESDWSPNGRSIVFVSGRDGDFEIYTMRLDGSRRRQLTVNNGLHGNPAWSPDGRKIAFNSDRDGDGEIYTMRPDGSHKTRLTLNEVDDFRAAWSPDGRKIAFTTDRDGNFEIYTMRADGSQQLNRTQNPAFDNYSDWQPLPKRHH
jgi:Tol biopolymer transport system component